MEFEFLVFNIMGSNWYLAVCNEYQTLTDYITLSNFLPDIIDHHIQFTVTHLVSKELMNLKLNLYFC